ncbi:MAG: methyltransferase domain-containing protein, partial [Nitrosopumilus sp.]
MESTFTEIYHTNYWGGRDSVSGRGSNAFQTRVVVNELLELLRVYDVQTLLDAACGDFNWMKHVNLKDIKYCGIDIVASIIESNKTQYAKEGISFQHMNLLEDELPKVDLVLCRDCLPHFSFYDIFVTLKNICRSDSKYLLTTTFPTRKTNKDILIGDWRTLNLEVAPFFLPKPLVLINEKCTENNLKYGDKSLGLWRIEDISKLVGFVTKGCHQEVELEFVPKKGIADMYSQNSKNRDAWVEKVLSQISSGLHILDVGAGTKRYKKFCSHLRYVSQDFCKYNGQDSTVGLQTGTPYRLEVDIECDILDIPEPDSSFDVVLCTEVFEHISNPIAAIQEFSRLLRVDGFLILTAPFCSLTHEAPYHFYSGLSRFFYEKFLVENGFEILSISTNGSYFEYLAQEVSRIEYVATRYADTQLSPDEIKNISVVSDLLVSLCNKDKDSSELL